MTKKLGTIHHAPITFRQHLRASVSEAWVLASNRRVHGFTATWTPLPTIHAVIIHSINVEEPYRRRGLCRAFIEHVAVDPRFELVILEGVGNKVLADALLRWGWYFDHRVMDFYSVASNGGE